MLHISLKNNTIYIVEIYKNNFAKTKRLTKIKEILNCAPNVFESTRYMPIHFEIYKLCHFSFCALMLNDKFNFNFYNVMPYFII